MKNNVLTLSPDVTPLTKETLNRALTPENFEVFWTANVAEAVEARTRHRIDLLLLDLNQPLRKGWGDYEPLITLNHVTPVVVLTEHDSAHEQTATAQVGAVLRKPFSAATLIHTINHLLNLPTSGVSTAGQDADPSASPTTAEDAYEMNSARLTTPLVLSSHRHWGINE